MYLIRILIDTWRIKIFFAVFNLAFGRTTHLGEQLMVTFNFMILYMIMRFSITYLFYR